MRAIRFKAFGESSVLEAAEIATPSANEATAVVRVMAASINPSDVKNVAGAMKQTTLPRIPGRDFAGVVEAGPAEWIGAEVWGTGGDAGFTRDGSHAAMIAVPVASLRRKPDVLSFDQAASVGVNYMAAWCGFEAAGLQAGETVLLIGAGGGVGGAAARSLDARRPHNRCRQAGAVAGCADQWGRREADRRCEGSTGRNPCGDRRQGRRCRLRPGRRRHVPQRDQSLAPRGRLVEIAATGQREVSFDLADFYHNESRLFGVDTLKRDLTASAEVLEALTAGFLAGDYRAAPIAATCGLGQAQEAYRKVAAGSPGRVVLRPQE